MAHWTQTTRAFIISLPRLADRRAHATRLAARLPVPTTILDAVDGRQLTAAQRALHVPKLRRPRYPFPLSEAEIACFLSHRAAWRAVVESGACHAVILEDDAVLCGAFAPDLARLMEVETDWSFVQLHSHRRPEPGAPFLARRTLPQLEMVGQVMTAEAALALLRASARFDRPVDSFIQMTWKTGVPIHHLGRPVVVNGGGFFGGSTISRGLGRVEKMRRSFVRPLYKAQLAILSARGDTAAGLAAAATRLSQA
ncbi:glycosyltransferase family 25 protein [Phreatobacter cathodiphilus]|uniref:Glycosyl transferase family 25 domain-containing protein n=1 Tax=Phreatobacter cathodiphilus TaxID=1868589 RepID=A0A2S0N6Q3_9HYPH|nr:glycosyltransferase family 25 protein [Phreatobacter cathodiphilus]AVO43830.1 hypothetical protein C6569_01385 [Phreatobacter cathodiphilus]